MAKVLVFPCEATLPESMGGSGDEGDTYHIGWMTQKKHVGDYSTEVHSVHSENLLETETLRESTPEEIELWQRLQSAERHVQRLQLEVERMQAWSPIMVARHIELTRMRCRVKANAWLKGLPFVVQVLVRKFGDPDKLLDRLHLEYGPKGDQE